MIWRGVIFVVLRPSISTLPADDSAHPGDRLDELALTVALDAGNAEDLAGAHLDVEPVDHRVTTVVVDRERVDVDHHVTRRGVALLDLEHDVAPDHQVGQRLLRRGLGIGGAGDPAVAQHRDPVGDGEHLAQLVGDEDDRLALIDEAADDTEEVVDLAWREDRGRLIEDQDVGLAEEGLDELDALLFADGEVADLRVGVDAPTRTAVRARVSAVGPP